MSETFFKIDSLQHLKISRQTYPTNRSRICVQTLSQIIFSWNSCIPRKYCKPVTTVNEYFTKISPTFAKTIEVAIIVSYCVFIQRAVDSLQKCSLLYSTWHLDLVIGRNQDWFHESNKGTLSEKRKLFRAFQNDSTSKARKVPLQTLNKRCRRNSARCRTRGTARRPMKSRATQTFITASALWCLEDCLAKTTATGSSRPPRYRWDSTADWEEEDLGETGWTL